MDNGDPPPPKKTEPVSGSEALGRLLRSYPRFELSEEARDNLAKLAAGVGSIDLPALKIPTSQMALGSASATAGSEIAESDESDPSPKGGVAGGGSHAKGRKRTRQGKVSTRGRHRVMDHWEIFDSELNELAGLQEDAIRSFSLAGFFGALSLDMLRDIFTSNMSQLQHALWFGLVLACALLAGWNYVNGRYSKKRGKTRLQEIKDEHDDL